jgi:transposase InsO family protein
LCGSRARYYFLVYKDIYDQFHRAPKLQTLLEFLVRAWQHLGLPTVLVADNDPIIATPGRWPGSLNRLWRLVRLVGVELRRIPEGEPWFNGSIENFNGWFPPRLLAIRLLRPARVRRELAALMGVCNNEHIHPQLGFRTTAEARKDLTMRRLPANFNQHHRKMALPAGKVTFLRRVRRSGRITVLSVRLNVGKRWAGR